MGPENSNTLIFGISYALADRRYNGLPSDPGPAIVPRGADTGPEVIMRTLVIALAHLLATTLRRRVSLALEIVALRHQLALYERTRPLRLRLEPGDRVLWSGRRFSKTM